LIIVLATNKPGVRVHSSAASQLINVCLLYDLYYIGLPV